MARLFLFSSSMAIVTLVIGAIYFFSPDPAAPRQMSAVEKDAKTISDFVQKQADITKQRAAFLQLGTFTIELLPVAGMRPAKGVLNLAEIEMFVQCDSRETRDYLFTHQARVKDRVAKVLPKMDREDLLSREGKKKLKLRVIKGLNEWLATSENSGLVQDVFFSKLMLN